MKRFFATFAIAFTLITVATAQEHRGPGGPRHFSPEEFKAKQRSYLTEKAGLTPDEVAKFFPLYFELQKKRFEMEHEIRKNVNFKPGKEMGDNECRKLIYEMADVKIEIAKLEKQYIEKFLKVIPPCKLNKIEHAEKSFQRDLMKKMLPPPPPGDRKDDRREKHEEHGPKGFPPPFPNR